MYVPGRYDILAFNLSGKIRDSHINIKNGFFINDIAMYKTKCFFFPSPINIKVDILSQAKTWMTPAPGSAPKYLIRTIDEIRSPISLYYSNLSKNGARSWLALLFFFFFYNTY